MAARVRLIRDATLALIEANWTHTDPDEVVATYRFDVYAKNLTGRKVLIFPESYAGFPSTREENTTDYGLAIWVVRRYEGQGDPTDAWIATELDFVEELSNWFDPRREPLFATLPEVYVQEANVTTIYDVVDLIENKLFVSVTTVLLREEQPA